MYLDKLQWPGTAQFKLNMLTLADRSGVKAAGRHFSIDRNLICNWHKQKGNLIAGKKSAHFCIGLKLENFVLFITV